MGRNLQRKKLTNKLWYENNKAHHISVVQRRNDRIRKERMHTVIQLNGGACRCCGYDISTSALEFHHRDPSKKLFTINTDVMGRKWQTILDEVAKCELLCANCHREHHSVPIDINKKYSNANVRDVAKLRHSRMNFIIAMKGGACMSCGYARCRDALEFHHRDPVSKTFDLNMANMTKAKLLIEAELEKCDLLCANCHREIHAFPWTFIGSWTSNGAFGERLNPAVC